MSESNVSTEEQKNHGLSVDNQIQALRDFVKDNGHIEVDLYNDAGLSASKSYKKRPELLRMLSDCRAKKIDLVIFTKLDRFFRSVPDYYACIEQMGGVPWRAIWEDYETESSAGKFKVNIMLSVAQAESDRTSERIRAINDYRRAQGKYVGGKAPTGYIKKDGGLIKDDSCAEGVQCFFNAYAKLHSMSEARAVALEHGVTIAKATAVRMLHNTAYYGDASGYKCEPYITVEQYLENQKHMNNFSRKSPANHEYLFSGLLICDECGAHIISKYATDKLANGSNKVRLGYECAKHRNMPHACSGGYYGQKKLEQMLIDALPDALDNYNYSADFKAINRSNEMKRSKLEQKLDRLAILFEEGDISIEDYRDKRDAIKKELSSIPHTELREVKPLPDNWRALYNSLDFAHKRAFWLDTIDCVYLKKSNGIHYRFNFK